MQHGIKIDASAKNSTDKERKIDGNELWMIRKCNISNKLSSILKFLHSCYWNEDLKHGLAGMKNFSDIIKQNGLHDKYARKIISKVSNHSTFDELYYELKI